MSEDRGTTVTTGNTSLQHNNNMDVEFRAKKKPSKFDSLKPLLNLLETLLLQHGMTQHSADLVVLDIAERFVTAGYGWDKIIQYQSKGEHLFSKKLIPHIFMSKDELPSTVTCEDLLHKIYKYIEDWKSKLYDMISFNTATAMAAVQHGAQKVPSVTIKEEPMDYTEHQAQPVQYMPVPVPMPSMHTNNLLTTLPSLAATQTISYPTMPYNPIQAMVPDNNTRRSRSPSPPVKKSKKKRHSSPKRSVSVSPSRSPPPVKQKKHKKPHQKATKKSVEKEDVLFHSPLKKFGVKEIQDIDEKTTFYKYDAKKEGSRTSSEKKLLLDKVSAILDRVNEECKTDSKEEKHHKEIILNKDSKTVTLVGNSGGERTGEVGRSRSRSPLPMSYQRGRDRSWSRSRSRSGSPGHRQRYYRSPPRRPRSWSRSPRPRYRSRSPPRRYRSRSRSWSPYNRWPQYTRPMWIAVSPVSIENDLKIDKNTEQSVSVILREKFSFETNKDCRVKISKWTGQDCISSLVIKPQVITLNGENKMDINVENPYYDRTIKLQKYDKIGCLSILSVPVPRSVRCGSPGRFQSQEDRWFRISHAVLHRKGQLDRIKIHPGKVMKIIATLKGAIKKYVGMEVLVSEIDGKRCPIESQVVRILENDCIGFTVVNRSREVLEIEKDGKNVAYVSVWSKMEIAEELLRR